MKVNKKVMKNVEGIEKTMQKKVVDRKMARDKQSKNKKGEFSK